jgi:hypothetical protein
VRGPDGVVTEAAIDTPRFDHAEDGTPRGLLVEGRPETGQADVVMPLDGAWAVAPGTVLHEYETPAGEIRRRAWYARRDPRSVIASCLAAKGRHRLIVHVPGHLKNRGGVVRWRDRFWTLGAAIAADPGTVLGVEDDVPLIEG